jgi:hypothetical protein
VTSLLLKDKFKSRTETFKCLLRCKRALKTPNSLIFKTLWYLSLRMAPLIVRQTNSFSRDSLFTECVSKIMKKARLL